MICIAGKNQIAVDGLRLALTKFDAHSVVVCPNRADAGQSGWQPSLVRYAYELGVRCASLEDLYKISDLIFISLEFDRIIRPSRFKSNALFNIHFSKLPAYKGVYTSAWPILNDENETAVTLHKIDHGIDTGDVIAQRCFALSRDETARSLYFRYMHEAFALLSEHFDEILRGEFTSSPQRSEGSSYFGRHTIDYGGIQLDFRATAAQVSNQVRALTFREFQLPVFEGIKIAGVEILADRSVAPAGRVLDRGADFLRVSTIDFDVLLRRDDSFDLLEAMESGAQISRGQLTGWRHLFEVKSRQGWTPLMIAAFNGDVGLCKSFIELGGDIFATNCNGTTPLMYAKDCGERLGDYSIVKLLLDAGAKLNQRDAFGRTVVDYCEMAGFEVASKFLAVASYSEGG